MAALGIRRGTLAFRRSAMAVEGNDPLLLKRRSCGMCRRTGSRWAVLCSPTVMVYNAMVYNASILFMEQVMFSATVSPQIKKIASAGLRPGHVYVDCVGEAERGSFSWTSRSMPTANAGGSAPDLKAQNDA